MCSGIGCLSCFRSLSKHVAINSIHIHTSESVMKQPRQRTISYTKMNYRCFEICLSLEHLKMLTEMCWKLDVTLQSCDLRTTSKSMKMRFVSSWLPVRRICFTAITYRIRNIFNIFGCNFWINKKIFGIHVLRGYYSTCPDGVCLIFTTLPQVPFPKSPKSSKSSMCAGIRLPLTYK